MWELRWILFGLGVVLIGGVYLWGSGLVRWPGLRRQSAEPGAKLEEEEEGASTHSEDAVGAKSEPADEYSSDLSDSERVVTVRFVPKEELQGDHVVRALRDAGLRHGPYGIFHRFSENGHDQTLFSVANLTEPGSFDLAKLDETTIPGMSFFMVLPGVGDPIERFDLMVATARSLAHELEGDLHDEKGSSWSIQRERYVREEIIRYRHSKR